MVREMVASIVAADPAPGGERIDPDGQLVPAVVVRGFQTGQGGERRTRSQREPRGGLRHGEPDAIHHHALDDYNENMMWALNKAHSFNPFSFALGGEGSGCGNSAFHKNVGGWEAKSDGKLVIPLDENGQIARKKEKMKHPFYELMAKAEKQWNDMVKR